PLVVLEDEPARFTVSMLRRLPASSNDVRVRVDASKNTLRSVLPRSVGTFRMLRFETSKNDSAAFKIVSTSVGERSAAESNERRRKGVRGVDVGPSGACD